MHNYTHYKHFFFYLFVWILEHIAIYSLLVNKTDSTNIELEKILDTMCISRELRDKRLFKGTVKTTYHYLNPSSLLPSPLPFIT